MGLKNSVPGPKLIHNCGFKVKSISKDDVG